MTAEEPRKPHGLGWTAVVGWAGCTWMWRHTSGVLVSSAVDDVTGDGPTWHIHVSQRGPNGRSMRPGRAAVRCALEAFEMREAEEDNHGPLRLVRSFWLPVDRPRRKLCRCKAEPPEEVSEAGLPDDRDQYTWRPDLRGAR